MGSSAATSDRLTAVVLSGGLGTRLRPLTYTLPKQLIPIAGRPVLYRTMDLLPPEVDRVVLAAGYKGEEIERYVHAHPHRFPVRVVIEDPRALLGTGGGLKNAASHLSDPFFFLYADTIASAPLGGLVRRQTEARGAGVLALYEVEDTRPYGVARLGPDDRITEFVEKPAPEVAPSHWINAGFAVWRHEILDLIPPGRPVSFEREIVPQLLGRGVYGFRFSGFFVDAGTLGGVLGAQRILFDRGLGVGARPPGAPGTFPDVVLMDGASATGASLGRYVTVGAQARVEERAHVEDSIVMDGATVERGARVSGSIVGPGVRVAEGTTVANAIVAPEPASSG